MADAELVAKGLDGVVVDETALSFVDGLNGVLIYLGYDIHEIAQCRYEEICHLFLHGELPNQAQLDAMSAQLVAHRDVPDAIWNYIRQTARTDHPMAVLRSAVSMLSNYMPNVEDLSQPSLMDQAVALTAKVATLAAGIGRWRSGHEILQPRKDLSHSANFLYMLNGEAPNDLQVRTLDTALVLHTDHSFNASTFTARVVASSLSDMVSAVTAAIGSLKGPLHGGANTAVMEMLQEIGSIENVEPWLNETLANKRKVMGFGHRVYKVLDPRAIHLKKLSQEWGERAKETKWFLMSQKLEQLVREKKGLNANVDFYSASTYYTMGIEADMFTVIFAVARVLGWSAHVIEQLRDNRIMRPKALYTGPKGKKYKPISDR